TASRSVRRVSPVTVTRTKTPASASQVRPSTTNRSGSRKAPGVAGNVSVKVKVPSWPGATVVSFCVAGRLPKSQLTPYAAQDRSSPATARCTSVTPLAQGRVPVLRKLSVIGPLLSPLLPEGHGVSDPHL